MPRPKQGTNHSLLVVRKVLRPDRLVWAGLRMRLWSHCSLKNHVTASIAITLVRGKDLYLGSARVLSEANAALYEAKEHGRNQVIPRHILNDSDPVVHAGDLHQ